MVADLLLSLAVAATVLGPTNVELAEQAHGDFEQYVADLKASDAKLRSKLRVLTTSTSRANATAQTWGTAETVATDAGSGVLKALGIGAGGVTGATALGYVGYRLLRRKRDDESGDDAPPNTTVNVTGVQLQRPVKADMTAETKP